MLLQFLKNLIWEPKKENRYPVIPMRSEDPPTKRPDTLPHREPINTPRPINNTPRPINNTPRPITNTPRPVHNTPRPINTTPRTFAVGHTVRQSDVVIQQDDNSLLNTVIAAEVISDLLTPTPQPTDFQGFGGGDSGGGGASSNWQDAAPVQESTPVEQQTYEAPAPDQVSYDSTPDASSDCSSSDD